jgi:hypothetical protein
VPQRHPRVIGSFERRAVDRRGPEVPAADRAEPPAEPDPVQPISPAAAAPAAPRRNERRETEWSPPKLYSSVGAGLNAERDGDQTTPSRYGTPNRTRPSIIFEEPRSLPNSWDANGRRFL